MDNTTPPADTAATSSPPPPDYLVQAEKWLSAIGIKPSPLGIRVAALLDDWLFGLHHLSNPHNIDWTNPIYIKIPHHPLSTFDFDGLTRLVFHAHDHCLRCDVSGRGGSGKMLLLTFHSRQREGKFAQRHPTLEAAVASHRENFTTPRVPAS